MMVPGGGAGRSRDPMASPTPLSDAKRRLSRRLLDEAGISGVGIRGDRLVVYLTADVAAVKEKALAIAREVAVTAPLVFEVTGELRKQ
jgi:hypothetical protein